MKLAIFDIDGTLTDTSFVDNECFAQTLFDRYGIRKFPTDGSHFIHYTDPAIFSQVYEEEFSSPLPLSELQRLKNHYHALLRAMSAIWPQLFVQIAGAGASLARLQRLINWRVAIATGSWEEAALLKLKTASIDYGQVPLSTANDGFTRETILETAVRRSKEWYRLQEFSAVVVVGDGVWDLRSAQRMKFGFVGVASGSRAAILRSHGAEHVLSDLTDFERLREYLEQAAAVRDETERHVSKQ
jgi:phosphoglycolate phosphatase-like HAD superfamily hydrolase